MAGGYRAPVPVDVRPLGEGDPRAFGPFTVTGRLGSGGMGVAYLAEDPVGSWVVVKTVRADVADPTDHIDRMRHEVEALRRIASPRIPRVLHTVLGADRPWFAMQFVPGITLGERISRYHPMPQPELSATALGLAECLLAVRAAGVAHRDLKPTNVLIADNGPHLIDFGTAVFHGATTLTDTGMAVGTLGWMAPEQVRGEPITWAVDVHAWALLVAYAATGREPFAAQSQAAVIHRILHDLPVLPPVIGPPLTDLVVRALSKDATARPEPAELVGVLTAARTGTGGARGGSGVRGPGGGPGGRPGVGTGGAGGGPAVGPGGAGADRGPGALPPPPSLPAAGAVVGSVVGRGATPRRHVGRTVAALTGVTAALVLAGGLVWAGATGWLPGGGTPGGPSTGNSASPSVSASPVVDLATWDAAKAAFADYRDAHPGTWSRAVPGGTVGGHGPIAVALQLDDGELVIHRYDDGEWSTGDSQDAGSSVTIEAMTTQVVDTTQGGGADILATITLDTGTTTGTILLNHGAFATFVDNEDRTHFYLAGLAMRDGVLTDAAGDQVAYRADERQFQIIAPDPWDLAVGSFAEYTQAGSGTWSAVVPGTGDAVALAVEGRPQEIVLHGFVQGSWRELRSKTPSWSALTDYEIDAGDVTGDGHEDLIIRARDDEGTWTGTVVGSDGQFLMFDVDDDQWGFLRGLTWDGAQLTDAYGREFTYDEDTGFLTTWDDAATVDPTTEPSPGDVGHDQGPATE